MRVIGLTGGIGMGKSTASAVFRRARLPVFDADRAVRALHARGGAAIPPIAAAFPEAVRDGVIDRARLRAAVLGRPEALKRIEAIIHPLVRDAERRFLRAARRRGARAAVLDIPLLFETGGQKRVDFVLVVSAPADIQRARVQARGLMSAAEIEAVIARQMKDAEKRRRADRVIPTGLSRHHAWRRLRRVILELYR